MTKVPYLTPVPPAVPAPAVDPVHLPLRLAPGFDPLLQAYGAMLSVTGGPDDHPHDTYEIVVDDGTCAVSPEPGERYDTSLMMAPPEFLKMVTGRGNPTMLVMRGKIKVKGDIATAAKFPTLFDIPKA